MEIKRIPVALDPNEIRHAEGAVESVWTPGKAIGAFQEWTRYWVRRETQQQSHGSAASLPVHMQPAIHDSQSWWNMFKEKCPVPTHGELHAPIGENKQLVKVQQTTARNIPAILVWSTEDGYDLDQESVAKLFPENDGISRQGKAWVVRERVKSEDERWQERQADIDRKREEEKYKNFVTTTDIVTGEVIRSAPHTGATQADGEFVQKTLDSAYETTKESGVTIDISRAVQTCHQRGPFRGFADMFTPEEQRKFTQADAALAERARNEFYRLSLAENVNEMLVKADGGFAEHVEPYIDRIKNPDARESVRRTLETWNANKLNPARNAYYRTRRYGAVGIDPKDDPARAYPVPLYRQHPQFFSVQKMDNSIATDNVGAGYEATMGLVMFRHTEEQSYDFLQTMNIMHEVTHKNQHTDSMGRSEVGTPEENHRRYVQAMMEAGGSMSHGVLEEECEAWSNMIELVHAKIGHGTFLAPQAAQMLGIENPDDKTCQNMYELLKLAVPYFAGGGRKGNTYPPDFVNALKKIYLDADASLYELNAEGFPVPYRGE
jgi:hypothetical protein